MAEGTDQSSNTGKPPAALVISEEKLMGQSKSSADNFVQFKDLSEPQEGTNKLVMVCLYCMCKIIRPGYGSLVEKEVSRSLVKRNLSSWDEL